jgi:hypothetical protein
VGDVSATNVAGSIPRFAQRSGYSFCVLRRVDARRSAASHDHSNPYPILQRTQLLEGFGALQRRCFPVDEAKEKIAPVAVYALVAEMLRACRSIAPERNCGPGKIKRVAVCVQDNFDLMR